MPIGIKKQIELDGKLCFELWARTGSVHKAPMVLENEYHITNSKSGKRITSQGVWLAANRYIINNMSEARPIFDQSLRANGILPTDKLWYDFVIPKVKRLSKSAFDKFMAEHSYLTPYL
jgi:hypothetical protein